MLKGTHFVKSIVSCRRGGVPALVRSPMERRSARSRSVVVQAAAVPARSGAGFLQLYKESLATSPILTKSVTCFLGGMLGDGLAQLASGEPFDVARNMRMASYGLLIGGPSGHMWHKFLDATVMPHAPKSTRAVLGKLAADQLAFAPLANVALFAFIECSKGTPHQTLFVIQEKLWPTLQANWALWPLANWIAFRFLSGDMRILYANIIGVAWCMYLSLTFYSQGKFGA